MSIQVRVWLYVLFLDYNWNTASDLSGNRAPTCPAQPFWLLLFDAGVANKLVPCVWFSSVALDFGDTIAVRLLNLRKNRYWYGNLDQDVKLSEFGTEEMIEIRSENYLLVMKWATAWSIIKFETSLLTSDVLQNWTLRSVKVTWLYRYSKSGHLGWKADTLAVQQL